MNPELRPLRDIHDTLGNPWWPLAPGWWLLLALVVGIVALIWHYRRARLILPAIPLLHLGDWRWDARRELQRLRRTPRQTSLKDRLAELSELLKRIAMARHGRAACAGLHGQAWLDWLSAHDPDGFDWRQQGQLLIRAPYAPDLPAPEAGAVAGLVAKPSAENTTAPSPDPGRDLSPERQLEQLIAATERWITAPLKTRQRRAESTQGPAAEPAGSSLGSPFGRLTKAYHKLATAFRQRRPPSEAA